MSDDDGQIKMISAIRQIHSHVFQVSNADGFVMFSGSSLTHCLQRSVRADGGSFTTE